ncbi:MAG TPA: hypothetical protein DDW76_34775 [Cyanobacteria bacterium UBA11369]|nr:hypothetical protein [Cyanobacteria bacterium UBA11371]HBE34718.1 hypothetical protein [Cyanobacteria bacterium UBA11368]HBE53777.1 hypothetical protein [Cyanobacteria bacterium UBA11369]
MQEENLEYFQTLVGYEESQTNQTSLENSDQTVDDILTKQPLWSNPWSKLILVSVGTGSAALLTLLFLGSIMSGGRKINPDKKPPLPTVTPPSTQSNSTNNTDELRTKLALQEQKQFKAASEELKKPEPQVEKSDTKPVPVAPKIPAPTPALATPPPRLASSNSVATPPPKINVREVVRPAPILRPATPVTRSFASIPRPATSVTRSFAPISRPATPVTRPFTPIARPVPQTVTLPRAQPSALPTQPSATTKPTPPKTDPMEEWIALSQSGSYGQSEFNSDSDNQKTTEANLPANDKPSVNPTEMVVAGVPKAAIVDRNKTAPSEPEKSAIEPGIYLPEEAHILRETALNQEERNFQVGQLTEASLLTPIVASEQSNSPTANQERFVIKLNKPLKDSNGQTLLPSGALVIFVVAGVNPNGLVMCNAIAVVVDGKEYQLPPNVISLRGSDGTPLIASKWGDPGGAIARMDATTAVMGAVGKVGQIMNQPRREQQEDSDNIYGTRRSTTIERGEPNLLGAVLDGGLNPLQQQIQQRNQQAVQEMQNRPTLWYVPEGKKVQVFVNRSFDM